MNAARPQLTRRAHAGLAGLLLLLGALVLGPRPGLALGDHGPTIRATPMPMAPVHLARWAEAGIASMAQRSSPDAPRLLARRGARPTWQALPREGWQLIDDFEARDWPRALTWPLVADLNAPFVTGRGYPWAPSPCESAPGTRALRAVGGGDGATLDCGAAYPAAVASSALLSLDLSRLSGARVANLRFDLWVEADPDEGLLVQLLRFTDDGAVRERRVVYSATGRVARWARAQHIDLTRLTDARDPAWQHDLRGGRAFLELLFVSTDGGEGGARGVLVDNLGLEVELAAPTATPRPSLTSTPDPGTTPPAPTPAAPVERSNLCTDIRNCHSLSVRAWIDRGCDGRNQVGHDGPLREEPRVDVRVGASGEALGTRLSRTGRAVFAFPPDAPVVVSLDLPQGFEMCPGAPNPARIEADDFNRYGRAAVDFRLQRAR